MPDESSVPEKNLFTALDGYFISPDEAKALEYSLLKDPKNEEVRWKLLGFYFAHQSCCLATSTSRGSHILWVVENHNVELFQGCHGYLRIFSKSEEALIPQIRSAWERRIEAKPDDYALVFGYGNFLRPLRPKEACVYLEKALELRPDCPMTKLALRSAQQISQKYEKEELSDPKRTTCFFEVISSVDELLSTTYKKLNPNEEIWTKFSNIIRKMAKEPSLLTMVQFPKKPFQADDPAEVICRSALKMLLEIHMSNNNEDGNTLREPEFQVLWNDLIK